MQDPSTPTEVDEAEASIPTEHGRDGPNTNLNCTFTVRQKAEKRTFPWKLTADEIQLASPRPRDEDEDEEIRETKRPRLEEPLHTSTDEGTTENTQHTTTVALPPPDTAAVDHADSGSVMDMYPKLGTTGAIRCWTPEEHAKLTNAVTKTPKKKCGKELNIDWVTVAALVPGRTKKQCSHRWHNKLVANIDPTTARTGKWTADEDKKLKGGVREHGTKNWKKLAALVPSRTKSQCCKRWHDTLGSNIHPATARTGKWTADEDKKLKDGVREHGTKNWKAIAALVPGRTNNQCRMRWHDASVSNMDPATARTGKWTADEDKTLKDAVREHGAKNWKTIAVLVTGRSKVQCSKRWHDALVSNIDPTTARTGKWTADEDKKLKDWVREHGTKNWKKLAALVSGRTKSQCHNRWCDTLEANLDPTTARAGKWTADDDKKLKDAVREHGAKNWVTIATLVSGRTKKQCHKRWHRLQSRPDDGTCG
jgi:hypothetical protein